MESSAQKPKAGAKGAPVAPPPATPPPSRNVDTPPEGDTGALDDAPDTPAKSTVNQHDEEAVQAIIKKYTAIAAAASLVPVPALDLATLAGIQIKMIHSISKEHGVAISDSAAKVAVSSLASTLPSGAIAGAGASLLKIVPGIGNIISAIASPGYYSAATYAVGQVFHSHFASGETLLSFDPAKAEDAYKTHFEAKAAWHEVDYD